MKSTFCCELSPCQQWSRWRLVPWSIRTLVLVRMHGELTEMPLHGAEPLVWVFKDMLRMRREVLPGPSVSVCSLVLDGIHCLS